MLNTSVALRLQKSHTYEALYWFIPHQLKTASIKVVYPSVWGYNFDFIVCLNTCIVHQCNL